MTGGDRDQEDEADRNGGGYSPGATVDGNRLTEVICHGPKVGLSNGRVTASALSKDRAAHPH
ncbi:MAG: hypothetical protein NVS9B1_21740 [Candidatus Dormibacteraceae bacterium]